MALNQPHPAEETAAKPCLSQIVERETAACSYHDLINDSASRDDEADPTADFPG
jgi:hypothetical protein